MTTTASKLDKLKELARKNPGGAFPLYGLAMEYKGLGRLEEASRTFANLLEKHPDYTPAFLHYGGALLEMGRAEEGAEIFKQGIEACRSKGDHHAREELEEALRGVSAKEA